MKLITFSGAGMLAGLAELLACHGYSADDQAIALGMEAPYLLHHENSRYFAGEALYQPQWLNLYLHPLGFHMKAVQCASTEVPLLLRSLPAAMLTLSLHKEAPHPVVYTGYASGRYLLENIRFPENADEDRVSMSREMLLRRLPESVTLYILEKIVPEPVDFIPLLLQSLENMKTYHTDLLAVLQQEVTHREFRALHTNLFRPLMQEWQPLSALIGDLELAEELRALRHDYRHVFIRSSPKNILLSERLSRSSITTCLSWLYEDTVDRLHELGVDNAVMESRLSLTP